MENNKIDIDELLDTPECEHEYGVLWCTKCEALKPGVIKPLYEMDGVTPVPKNENEAKHINNPFYKDAAAYIEQMRWGQILKGAEKYPEPFTTASWTSEEIIDHAMQENVDQAHYIYAAKERMLVLEKDLSEAKEKIRELKSKDRVHKVYELEKENLRLAQENKQLIDDKELLSKLYVEMILKEG